MVAARVSNTHTQTTVLSKPLAPTKEDNTFLTLAWRLGAMYKFSACFVDRPPLIACAARICSAGDTLAAGAGAGAGVLAVVVAGVVVWLAAAVFGLYGVLLTPTLGLYAALGLNPWGEGAGAGTA